MGHREEINPSKILKSPFREHDSVLDERPVFEVSNLIWFNFAEEIRGWEIREALALGSED